MSFNTFGKIFRFTTWGESHGPAIGCVVDGCPPNIKITEKDIQIELNKRKPGQSKFTTQRKEDDKVNILSGVFGGKTTGTPISMIIYNKDMRSRDYETIKNKFRPGHADFTYFNKYGIRDYRGGGRQSARETASRVAAGAIAKKVLENKLGKKFKVVGAVTQLGILGCDVTKWNDSAIRKNPFFCPDKSITKIWGKTKVVPKGDDVIITGHVLTDVTQTAAEIENKSKVKNKDHRVFLDGIYKFEKNKGIEK